MNIKYIVAALLVVSSASTAMAQTTGTQKFKVIVPTNVQITAPSNVVITHDQTEADQSFPAQQWIVRGNTLAGCSVSFSTNTAFIHTVDTSFKRDAQLGLALNTKTGPATWTVSQASDTTNYVGSDEVATVVASSNGVGRGTFDLSMKFVTNGFGSFAAGDYETTVTGTVTAN
jgi:hypothetical protein